MENDHQQQDEMQEIINDFIVESSELIETVIQDIVTFEKNPDADAVNGIFRAVHTIKGTSSFLGFNTLSTLAHKAEDILGLIRKGEMTPNSEIADTLLETLDLMKLLIEDIGAQGHEAHDTAVMSGKLAILKAGRGEKKKIGELLVEENVLTIDELEKVLKKQDQEKDKKLGEILVEEKLITEGQLKGFLLKQKSQKEEQTIRIDVKKLDELMNLVGELVLGKNRLILFESLMRKGSDTSAVLDNLGDVTNYIEAITNDLQSSVMRARLVPVGKLFNTVPRLVRDLCGEFKKSIDLKIEGEETELDRSLVEALHDPLIHIIRNSVYHGIEAPGERESSGKPAKGTLSVKAYNEGNHVIIEIFDDGKGVNLQAVKEKVKEKDIVNETELNLMSSKELMNLIFIPGLSTAKKLSSVSGRGVGMDVVKTNIEKMNGQAYVDSEEGKWTKLTIKLPLTLAIMRALIIKTNEEFFAIPLNTVTELVKLKDEVIKTVDKNEVLVLRDNVIPIVDLSKVFSLNHVTGKDGYLVICTVGEKLVGVKTDSVIGQEEVVIKPLGEFLGNIVGVSGATIRGDGKAILILDIPAIVNAYISQKKASGMQVRDRMSVPGGNNRLSAVR
jgi:two-component system chemotaxis sensor kinase CheA